MPPKNDPKDEAARDPVQNELVILEAKRSAFFARLQTIYKLSVKAYADEIQRKTFLNSVSNLDQLRSDFERVLDSYNECVLRLTPDATANYQSWIAFEDMYCQIKRIQSEIESSPESQRPLQSALKQNLPPMQLMEFNGDLRNWPLFYEQFKSVIHNNSRLTDSERIQFLVGKLTDKARSVCAGLPATGENYPIIWQALVDKYEDKRAMAAGYINQLLDFKPIANGSASNLEYFLCNFDASVKAFKALKLQDLADFLFLHIALQKLDPESIKLFEMFYRKETCPSYKNLIDFVKEQSRVASHSTTKQTFSQSQPRSNNNKNIPLPKNNSTKTFVNTQTPAIDSCLLCKTNKHEHLYQCAAFTKMSPYERFNFVKTNSVCNNCLSYKHKFSACMSHRTCSLCNAKHHTLLHFNPPHKQTYLPNSHQTSTNNFVDKANSTPPPSSSNGVASNLQSYHPADRVDNGLRHDSTLNHLSARSANDDDNLRTLVHKTTLLGTAKIRLYDASGKVHYARILVDPGSQSDYITLECCNRLALPISNQNRFARVQGIGGSSQKILGMSIVQFSSRFDSNGDNSYTIQPLVVESITSHLPDSPIDISLFDCFKNIPLADDCFNEPGPIDMLIGANLFCDILLSDKVRSAGLPSALETTLGYVIMGDVTVTSPPRATRALCAFTHEPLNQTLEKFWNLEEVPSKKFLSPDDKECEQIFTATTTRNDNGSYAVDLPFKQTPDNLGNSFVIAKRRFSMLENKFLKYPQLRDKYDDVIRDYLDKGIISLVPPEEYSTPGFCLPHHPVIRNDKSTTKIRQVLDGSCKSDSGLSLNDILHTGCNLQADIFHILLNVRIFRVAFFADVRQMYLCIEVHPHHRSFQRFLYRFSPEVPLEMYHFNRVCFGIRSSPFLALRTLRQLASDERERFPHAAAVLERDVYMDDLASSASSSEEAVAIANQLISLFKAGGFDLVKWTSNSPQLLEHIPISHRQSEDVSFGDGDTLKILGLRWLPASDEFVFDVSPPQLSGTKRAILSATARLYDVLGFVGPVILYSKLLIKELWLLRMDWDDLPPPQISHLWEQFISELPLISALKFPRHLGVEKNSKLTLLAFADASEKAYGCVIYAHVVVENQDPVISLICSKSKVAPVKTVTVARLELCAIVLMSKLLRTVHDVLSQRHPIADTFAFSDSEVALCWVHSSPHRFTTFVANRIAQCQNNFAPEHFYHVPGSDNAADCLSRGLLPSRLKDHNLWFRGPPWASLPVSDWPITAFSASSTKLPEEKTTALVANTNSNEHWLLELSEKFSSWNRFLRTVVMVLKFLKRLPRNREITADDLDAAELLVVKVIQQTSFSDDISKIQKGRVCSPALRKLFPFIRDNVLRVGGRLGNSSLDFSSKHPALLPKKGHIVELLIDFYHRENLHSGPQLLLSILRQRYWILSARRIVRQRFHKCNDCFRAKPTNTFPAMADLPDCRVEPSKCFTHTGVDYAGPFYITLVRKRGVKSQKAWLCIFVCLVTKAVHTELASSLSSAAFLDAFKRFISRRGDCKFLYSDHGTNFTASKAYLNELHTFLQSDPYYTHFKDELAKSRITWRMSPPNAPHFGGIWEGNIKCFKTHLHRVIGNQILTYEELLTVLTQIEAILNSRPLYILSSDPSEPTALTPAHFMSTSPLPRLPAADLSQERPNLLTRFSMLDSLVQSFWKRFRVEYLHNLQSREKWNTPDKPIAVGTIVLINVANAPPLQWPLGIITRVFPGRDGVVRVAEVRTRNGTLERPIVRLCPLPTQ